MSARYATQSFHVNGRTYDPPHRPVVVVCIDGCADEYLSVSMAQGRMPHTAALARDGYRGLVRGALPSFTNVNNSAIVTGLPPSETGIGGNYFLDPDTGEEVMMNAPSYLQADTILAAAARAGRKVAMVTAKDKLRALLSKGMTGIAFSAEKADEVNLEVHGIADVESRLGLAPAIYSAASSVYVLQAGVYLLESGQADFLYLSLTDYMQHAYAPEEAPSLAFYEDLDREIGKLRALGAVMGLTADHGMNAKVGATGQPNVVYLESVLREQFGEGIRVICPITDPYVVHHGALGSAVTVYVPDRLDRDVVGRWILQLEGISEVYDREMAALKLELPARRIGDLFVLSNRDYVLGRTPEHHDLSQLKARLRSHGGRYEEMVPMVLSEPLNATYRARAGGDPRNFDIFEFTCNGAKP